MQYNLDLKENLQKNMMISIVKIKLCEAKILLKKTEIQLEKAIKFGNGQQIYDSAFEHFKAKDRYGHLKILHEVVKEGA